MNRRILNLICASLVLFVILCVAPARKVCAAPAGDRLDGFSDTIYDFLKTNITEVANGNQTSTQFAITDANGIIKFTKEELGVSSIIVSGQIAGDARSAAQEKLGQTLDFNRVLHSLMVDCPFELFWYDKVSGAQFGYLMSANSNEIKITSMTFKFPVCQEYSAGDYLVDAGLVQDMGSIVYNAQAIVNRHADKSDWDKLAAYKDEICDLVSYNHSAAENDNTPYGAPWQLVSVFDNDPSTNVVCEGYAKAFQYLCDLTDFDTDVECYLVEGYMQGGTGAGGHMWNVVKINGGTLLVDVTNCDEGTAGAPDKLFLQVGQKNGDYYTFDCGSQTIYYAYSATEEDLHTDGYLELKPATQQPPVGGECAHDYKPVVVQATLTKDGSITQTCSHCGDKGAVTTISRVDAFSLTEHISMYDGTAKTPAPIVWDREGNALVEGRDYTLSYPANRTEPGTYELVVTLKGNYSGTKTLEFYIALETPTVSVANAANGVKVAWNSIFGAKSYSVFRSVYTNGAWSPWTAIKTGATGTSYTDTAVQSNANVKYMVRAVNGSYASDYAPSNAIKFLAVPTVTVSNAANGVKISWNKISGAANYKVYKSIYTNGAWSSWTAIKTGVTGTTYTDTAVKSADNVKYTVRAFNGSHSSTFKASNSLKYLAAPTVKASNAVDGVKLTWNKVGGAKTYTVYKSTYTNGAWSGWKAIKTGVTGTTYTDTTVKSGNNVKYTVRAVNGNFSSYFTSSNSIKFLATPTVKASNAVNGVKLTWNAVGSAKTYTVYKSTYTNGAWSGWKAIKTGVTGTTYTDTSVKSNDNVRYTVKVINGSFTSYIKASNSIKFLATPTVTATNAAKGVTITWNKITGAKTYTVYRSTYSNGKWSGWTAIKTGATGTSYTDTAVKSGATVRYTVKAINGSFTGYIKASNTTKFLTQPTVKVAKATNGIKASWAKVTGASGYIVYRRTYSGGKWGSWASIKTTTALSYTDTTAKAGVTYQYTVRAYSGSYKSSFTASTSIKR